MNEIIKSKNSSYDEYETLVLERDALLREAGSYHTTYLKEFGELITKVFEKKIDCIAKKKRIAFCQAAANRGEHINITELEKYISDAMAAYNSQLESMKKEYDEANKSKEIPQYRYLKVKSLYRKIARMIHPDINPLGNLPEFAELWDRVAKAYAHSDLEEMQALEVLIHKAMDENGLNADDIEIPDIEERIGKLRDDIEKIVSTDPYQYKFLLEDSAAVAEKKRGLEEEYNSYIEYEKQLNEILKGFLKNGVTFEWEN